MSGKLRIGGDVTKVGAEGDLEPAAKCDPVDRRNHRHLYFLPNPRRALRHVGWAFFTALEQLLHQVRRAEERGKIEPRAKTFALPVQDDCADGFVCDDALAHGDEPVEHVRVQAVALLGARHTNRRDRVVYGELHSFGHTDSLVEDDCLVVVDQDSVVKVPTHGTRQHDFFQVAALAYQVLN
jgi:hypothetical protein